MNKKTGNFYEPELGQAVFGCPTSEYELPEFAEALLMYILNEIERVYWNVNRKEWENYQNPGIPQIKVRPYYWGEDEKEARKPNLQYHDVQIFWYKYPSRGVSCNILKRENEWRSWFDSCLKTIREYENDNDFFKK